MGGIENQNKQKNKMIVSLSVVDIYGAAVIGVPYGHHSIGNPPQRLNFFFGP